MFISKPNAGAPVKTNSKRKAARTADNNERDTPENQPPGYEPAKVWAWEKENGGAFASTNRPVAGASHDAEFAVLRLRFPASPTRCP